MISFVLIHNDHLVDMGGGSICGQTEKIPRTSLPRNIIYIYIVLRIVPSISLDVC